MLDELRRAYRRFLAWERAYPTLVGCAYVLLVLYVSAGLVLSMPAGEVDFPCQDPEVEPTGESNRIPAPDADDPAPDAYLHLSDCPAGYNGCGCDREFASSGDTLQYGSHELEVEDDGVTVRKSGLLGIGTATYPIDGEFPDGYARNRGEHAGWEPAVGFPLVYRSTYLSIDAVTVVETDETDLPRGTLLVVGSYGGSYEYSYAVAALYLLFLTHVFLLRPAIWLQSKTAAEDDRTAG